MKIHTWLSIFLLSVVSSAAAADGKKVTDLPIIDAHIHYSHDVGGYLTGGCDLATLVEILCSQKY